MEHKKEQGHLTLEMRMLIEDGLRLGMSFKAMGKRIGKDQTTVSREVKRHMRITPSNISRKDKDGNPIVGICPSLLKAPFVCNPCKKRYSACPYDKHMYLAKQAQCKYEEVLRSSREGIPLTKPQFYANDAILKAAVEQGQHIYHIVQSGLLSVSKSTVYAHIKKGYMSISQLDLPRAVKFKPRKKHKAPALPRTAKIGRTYTDFQTHIHENGISSWVEMDTVTAAQEKGKVIMTLDFTLCNFMIAILLPDKTAASVSAAITNIKKTLRGNGFSFGDIFPIILTDNGGEFSNISAIEQDLGGNRETRLFFCDPYNSSQKPHVEKNHTLFRDIVPKGKSFERFTQETVNLIFSHVNGVKRNSLNGKSPYEMFTFIYGTTLAELFGIEFIPPEAVVQSEKLLNPSF